MFYQISLLQQVKRWAISIFKYGMYKYGMYNMYGIFFRLRRKLS